MNLEDIYRRNIDTVYATAFLHLKNKSDAEDAAQTVFMKYLAASPDFTDENHEKAWFILTTRNHCRNMLKHWWNRLKTDTENEESCVSAFAGEKDGDLTEMLMTLPEKYRELIYFYYYEEYSVKEISHITGKNESTIRTQLARAREKLKKKLERKGVCCERSEVNLNV